MKTEIVKAEEFGIEPNKANELMGNLPQITSERDILEAQYNDIIKMDIEDVETSNKARVLRLQIRDNRTKGLSVWHRTTKDVFLRAGQFIDALKRKEEAVNNRMESALEEIEKHAEIKEKKRLDELEESRRLKLEPFSEFVPFGADIRTISDEDFTKIFNGAKMQMDAKIEAENKAKQERIEQEKKEAAEREAQRLENIKLKAEAEKREEEIRIERVKQAKKEAAEREQREKEQAEVTAKLEAERKEKQRVEAELQAKKDAEQKAIADAEKARQSELSKGDAAKRNDLLADLEKIKSKYEFKSTANVKMYAETCILIDKVINHIQK
jgi:colicin import membrane protein